VPVSPRKRSVAKGMAGICPAPRRKRSSATAGRLLLPGRTLPALCDNEHGRGGTIGFGLESADAIGKAITRPITPASRCITTAQPGRISSTGQPSGLLHPWRSHSDAEGPVRLKGVVARRARARLGVGECDSRLRWCGSRGRGRRADAEVECDRSSLRFFISSGRKPAAALSPFSAGSGASKAGSPPVTELPARAATNQR